MSAPNWTPRFRGMLQTLSPELVEELDGLAAFLKGQFANISTQYQTIIESEKGLEDHTTVPPNTPNTPDQPSQEEGIRWLKGPWLFGPDGNMKAFSAIRPPDISSTRHNYAPDGIDTTVILELQSTTAVSITGIKRKMQQRRILGIFNRGGFTISLVNQSTSSQAYNRFDWGTTGDAGDTIGIPTGQMVWLFYDVVSERWRLFAIPAVGSSNLPTSLVPTTTLQALTGFETGINTDSLTFQAAGEPAPTTTNMTTAVTNLDEGHARAGFTGNSAGAMAGMYFGGTNGGSCNLSQQPCWRILIRTDSSVAATRLWFILTDQTLSTSITNADEQVGNYVGFRYSSVAGDSNWMGVTRDGTTQSTVDTGVAVSAATVYQLKVRYSNADAKLYFSVNSEDAADEVELSANIPTTSTALAWSWRVIATTATGKAMDFFRMTLRRGATPADGTNTNQYLPSAAVPSS